MSVYTLFDNDKIFVLGHRGFSEKFPENTMPSFRACVDVKGVDGVELDVHECKSGEIVVAHDGNLKRICGLDKFIEDLTWDELKELDAGIFKGPEFKGTRMPLLEELFQEVGNKIIYDIELKVEKGYKYKRLCEKTWALIQKYHLEENVMVSSFHPFALRYFNRICWMSVPTADIFHVSPNVPRLFQYGWGRYISNSSYLKPEHIQFTEEYAQKVKRPLIGWTVNTKEDAQRMLKVSTTKGMIGNNPVLLADVLSKIQGKN